MKHMGLVVGITILTIVSANVAWLYFVGWKSWMLVMGASFAIMWLNGREQRKFDRQKLAIYKEMYERYKG